MAGIGGENGVVRRLNDFIATAFPGIPPEDPVSQDYLDTLHKEVDERRAWAEVFRSNRRAPTDCTRSDSESSQAEGTLITPPPSPGSTRPDLSQRAWDRRIWTDRSKCIEPYDTGFDRYNVWQAHVLAERVYRSPTSSARTWEAGTLEELLKKSDELPKEYRPSLSEEAWTYRVWSDRYKGIEPSCSGFDSYQVWEAHTRAECVEVWLEKSRDTTARIQARRLRRKREGRNMMTTERFTRSKASTTSLFYELGSDGKTGRPLATCPKDCRSTDRERNALRCRAQYIARVWW